MTEKEYLKKLKKKLSPLKGDDKNALLDFYKEMIEDKMESGLSEEQAVAELESPETVAERTLAEYGLQNKPERKLSVLSVILIVIGSPLWLALGVAALGIGIAALCVVFALVVAMVAVCLSLTLGGAAAFAAGIVLLFSDFSLGLVNIGGGLASSSAGVLLSIACFKLIAFVFPKIKNLFKKGRKLK